MSSLPSWAQRFGIPEHELADLQNQLQASGDDSLRWILLNGHIDQREYLQWAMETYELPRVKDEYFAIAPDLPFWEAVRHDFAWTKGFLPLAEWQGVLLIGCVEPPRFHFPLRSAHRFVLVPASLLEQRFAEYGGTVSTPEVRQRPMDEFLADSLPPAPNVSLENPDGLVHEIPPASTPNLFVVPDGLPTDVATAPVSSLPDGFAEGTGVIDFSALDENSIAAAAPVVAPVVAPVTPPSAPPVAQEHKPMIPPGPPKFVIAPAAPVTSPPVDLSSRPLQDPQANVPQAPPAPVTPLVSAAKTSVAPMTAQAAPLETCANFDALGVATIAHILKHFEQGVVLLFQGGELRPWKWTEQLLSVKGDSPDAIPLEAASIFRIAYRTCLPYHGYVVTNPTNAAFFNAFNRGTVPKHATVIPVLINGQLVGMLMGLAMDKVDYKASLIAMEKLASEFGTHLDRVRSKQAA